ncbi:MAG: hypothetical protein JXB05_06345 [Myxococcaceae bacterium]|nr:hypothetical protein [Myxococcaceae bacterium]
MSCDDVAAAIVDEGLPRPAELQAHLEQCPRCRELARLHAAASKLRLSAPPPLAPVSQQAILGEVRRRHHRRRAAAGAALVSAVAAAVLLVMPPEETTVPARDTPPEQVVEAPSLELLLEEVEGYAQRDLTFEDETYAPFGALALWVRPSTPSALSERPFRTALAPLHPSPTQEPAR